MRNFFTKKIKIPTEEKQELTAMEVWSVRWYSRYGEYSNDIRKECEFFTNPEDANAFKLSLEEAFRLIRHTSKTTVELIKEK